jgi:hypothetical protein
MAPTWPLPAGSSTRAAIRWPVHYEWPAAQKWVGALRSSLARQLTLTSAEIVQPFEGVVLIEFVLDGSAHEVAIDYFDRDRVLDEVLERCPLVFKMQYRRDGYGSERVIPGGYVAGRPYLHRYLPGLRQVRDRGRPRFDVYGRFGLSYAPEIRRAAVETLRAQDEFRYEGTLALLPYSAYLREAALSRVCLDLPGNGDLCHRLVDYLAIGCCVVRPEPRTRLHVPLTDGVNIRYVHDLERDLVGACAELVAEPARAEKMGLAARDYFDRYLHTDQLAGYYIDRCLTLLGG